MTTQSTDKPEGEQTRARQHVAPALSPFHCGGQKSEAGNNANNQLALYVHWPFCKKKCPYCDFNSHVREQVDHERWRTALLSELRHMHAISTTARPLTSIFFGGGTPSLMQAKTVADIIETSKALWGHDEHIEITLEANPTSVEASTFGDFAAVGINRASLGIQSLRADSLAFLGREHSADEALRALESANAHFSRTNFDLIYALPDHTPESWERELRDAMRYARGHLSLYQLTIEPNTAFYHAYHTKREFILPDEARAAALYDLTQSIMESYDMPAYEISNHARIGEASRHNLSYWRGDSYIGVGPGAHGRICVDTKNKDARQHVAPALSPFHCGVQKDEAGKNDNSLFTASHTLKSPELWLESVARNGHGIEQLLTITPEERMEERLLMHLRLAEGFSPASLSGDEYTAFEKRINPRALTTLINEGLLTTDNDVWRTTARGRLVLNAIIESLLT